MKRAPLPPIVSVPADEVLLSTCRVMQLRREGYSLDTHPDGSAVVYPRDAVHATRYCVMRHGGEVSDSADTLRPPPPTTPPPPPEALP